MCPAPPPDRYCPFCGQILPRHYTGGTTKPVDLDRALEILSSGASIREAARQMGMSYEHLRKAVRASGSDYRASPGAKLRAIMRRVKAASISEEKPSG